MDQNMHDGLRTYAICLTLFIGNIPYYHKLGWLDSIDMIHLGKARFASTKASSLKRRYLCLSFVGSVKHIFHSKRADPAIGNCCDHSQNRTRHVRQHRI